jgi:tetratricopeptide (TPR) repeat protein
MDNSIQITTIAVTLFLFFSSCEGVIAQHQNEDIIDIKSISERIDQLIANDRYEIALNSITEAESILNKLKEKVHLNYGIFLEYRGNENDSMRERMNGALSQYIEVLKINPNKQKAISEVEKIMGIYKTMPEDSPGESIMKDLRELGFDY